MAYVVGSAEVELVPSAHGFSKKADVLLAGLKVGVELDPDIAGLRARVAEMSDLKVRVDVDLSQGLARAELDTLTRDRVVDVGTDLHDLTARAELDALTHKREVNVKVDLHPGMALLELDLLTLPRVVMITPVVAPAAKLPDLGGGSGPSAFGGLSELNAAIGGAIPMLGKLGPAAIPAAAGIALLATAVIPLTAGLLGMTSALIPIAAVAGGAALGVGSLLAVAAGGVAVFAGVAAAAYSTSEAFQTALQPSLDGLKSTFTDLVEANLGDLLAPLQAGIGLLSSILPALTPIIHAVSIALVGLIAPLQEAVDNGTFGVWVDQIAGLVGPALTSFGTILDNLTKGIGGMIPALAPLGTTILDGLVKMSAVFAEIGQSKGFQDFIAYVIENIPAVSNIFNGLIAVVGSIVTAMAPLGASVADDLGKWLASMKDIGESQGFKDFLAYMVENVPIAAKFIGNLVGAIVNILAAFAPIGSVVLPILTEFLGFIASIPFAMTSSVNAIIAFVDFLPHLGQGLADAGKWLVQTGSDILNGLWAGIATGAEAVWAWFVALPGVIWGFLVDAGTWLLQTGSDILTGLWDGITTGAEAVWAWFLALPGVILGFLVDAAMWLVQTGADALNGMQRGIVEGYTAVSDWLGALPGRVLDFFAGAGQWLWDTGSQIVNGLWNGISNAWNGFIGWIQDRINEIPKAVRDVLGIASPSKVMMEIGGFMGDGLQLGLSSSLGTAMDAAQSLIQRRVGDLSATGRARVVATVDAQLLGGGSTRTMQTDLLGKIATAVGITADKAFSAQELARATRMQTRGGIA